MPDLFGKSDRLKPVRGARQPVPPADFQALIGLYRREYEQRHGEPPAFTPRDAGVLKTLVTQVGLDRVRVRLPVFLDWDDPYIKGDGRLRGRGYSITVLFEEWNRLTAHLQQRQTRESGHAVLHDCRHEPRCQNAVDHGKRQIAELRRVAQ